MVDPGDDFGGYMEQLAATEDAAARAARILEEHEVRYLNCYSQMYGVRF